MMVVTVMAVALHLLLSYGKSGRKVKCFCLRAGWPGEENVPMRNWLAAIVLLCLLGGCAAAPAQREEQRDPRPADRLRESQAPAPEDRVDINRATVEELMRVPGLTRGWALRIVRYRPYRTKADLYLEGVVPATVYERIRYNIIAHRMSAPETATEAAH